MNVKVVFGILLVILGIFLAVIQIYVGVIADYNYNKDVIYNWNLADKTSTLEAKSAYINAFIFDLEKTKFPEYNAIWLKTPNNNVQNNINAVKTLRQRLNEIKGLDPESFAYQTAIQQITAQEQGEAYNMLGEIEGGYLLYNYPLVWNWIMGLYGLFWISLIIIGILLTGLYWENY